MKKAYFEAEAELFRLNTEDVITTSVTVDAAPGEDNDDTGDGNDL